MKYLEVDSGIQALWSTEKIKNGEIINKIINKKVEKTEKSKGKIF